LVEVEWGVCREDAYQADIAVQAYDRPGLLRDITALLANEKINLKSVTTSTDTQGGIAHMHLALEIPDIDRLSRVLSRIGQLLNVV
jgi:GTP pyrophosphokinase